MNTLKSIANGLALALLPVMLFTFGVTMSAYQVLSSPDPLKKALEDSNIYDTAIRTVLDSAQEKAAGSADIPIDNPEIQAIIREALPPEQLETQAEGAIDSTYRWLQGETDSLSFSFDLGDTKTKIADGLATYTGQYLSKLPPCDTADTTAVTDPLHATCLPAGYDTAAAVQKVRDEIANNPQFLQDATITPSEVRGEGEESLQDQLNRVSDVYDKVRLAVYLSGALAVICAVTAIFCAGAIRNGIKRVALISLIVGAVSAVLAWAGGFVLDLLTTKVATIENAALQASILKAVDSFTSGIRNWWMIYGLLLAVVGGIALLVLFFTRPPKDQIKELPPKPIIPVGEATRMREENKPAIAPTTDKSSPGPAASKKPERPRRLVQ